MVYMHDRFGVSIGVGTFGFIHSIVPVYLTAPSVSPAGRGGTWWRAFENARTVPGEIYVFCALYESVQQVTNAWLTFKLMSGHLF